MRGSETVDLKRLINDVLRKTRVIPRDVEEAVISALKETWPDCKDSDTEVCFFKAGVLHLAFTQQARLAEASTFHAETIRNKINQHLEALQTDSMNGPDKNPESRKEALYVTKITFRLLGTDR